MVPTELPTISLTLPTLYAWQYLQRRCTQAPHRQDSCASPQLRRTWSGDTKKAIGFSVAVGNAGSVLRSSERACVLSAQYLGICKHQMVSMTTWIHVSAHHRDVTQFYISRKSNTTAPQNAKSQETIDITLVYQREPMDLQPNPHPCCSAHPHPLAVVEPRRQSSGPPPS